MKRPEDPGAGQFVRPRVVPPLSHNLSTAVSTINDCKRVHQDVLVTFPIATSASD